MSVPSVLPLFLALAIVIGAAKFGGWALGRLGQPPVLGDLLVGLLLGPTVLNLFAQPYFAATETVTMLKELGEIGLLFLMFAAGLETQVSDLVRTGKPAVFSGTLGVVTPIALSIAVVPLFGYTMAQAYFIGIILAATSTSISAQTLMEMGRLRSREGMMLLGAAVVDDVLAVALLSASLAVASAGIGAVTSAIWVLLRMVLFLVGAFFVARWLLPRLARRVAILPVSEATMAMAIVSVLLLSWASEAIGGVAAITGAFIAGLALAGSEEKSRIEEGFHTLNYAFFVPLFMVSIGLMVNARALSAGAFGFAAVLSLVAIASKVVGCGLGGRFGGATWLESLRLGIGMVSRGEVGLIVASVVVSSGVIDSDIYAITVIVVLVTILITPPLLRWSFSIKEENDGRAHRAGAL